jgi:succinate dehydrogenase/fumarate reductase-like Fe-S protein
MNEIQKFEKSVAKKLRKEFGIPKSEKTAVLALIQWINKEAQPQPAKK